MKIKLANDSHWKYEGPLTVNVSNIIVYGDEDKPGYKSVIVEHDTTWNIHRDSGFEKAISEHLGFKVFFCEQGLQEDGEAYLEGYEPFMYKESAA